MGHKKLNLENKLCSVFGLHETGKTHFTKIVADKYNSVVFDVLNEYDKDRFDIWKAESDSHPEVNQEYNQFLEYIRNQKRQDEASWNLQILDEASTVLPNKKPVGSTVNNFLNYYRHPLDERGWDMGGIFVARRPARVNTNIVELSRYLVIFRVTGKNDIKYLNSVATGLGDEASGLSGHEFILVEPDREYSVQPPL